MQRPSDEKLWQIPASFVLPIPVPSPPRSMPLDVQATSYFAASVSISSFWFIVICEHIRSSISGTPCPCIPAEKQPAFNICSDYKPNMCSCQGSLSIFIKIKTLKNSHARDSFMKKCQAQPVRKLFVEPERMCYTDCNRFWQSSRFYFPFCQADSQGACSLIRSRLLPGRV